MTEPFPTLLHGLLAHAAQDPEAPLYRVIADDETVTTATRAEFLAKVRRVATLLAEHGTNPGARVLLMLPNSMEFLVAFFACLFAGAVAVPAARPRKGATAVRLAAVFAASRPDVLICLPDDTGKLAELAPDGFATATKVIALDLAVLELREQAALPESLPAPESIALIQFTSGSTSQPRGIAVSQANLAVNIEMMNRAYGKTAATRALSWLPVFHDAGLVCMGISPAIHGGSLTLSSPQRFIRRPRSWLEDISRYGITCTGAPNFAFDLAVRSAGEVSTLNLSTLECLWNGAETVSADSLRRFGRKFAASGFRAEAINPAYGLAEATIGVSGGPPGSGATIKGFDALRLAAGFAEPSQAADAVELVASGVPGWRNDIRIIDAGTSKPLPDGYTGEIWIAGPHIAQGYWGEPEATAANFAARTADGSGPYLRSGDLGFLLDGRLYIAGRLKETIIIRGRNFSPDEIELICARAMPALPLSQLVAIALPGSSEQLGLIVELPGITSAIGDQIASELRRAVSGALGLSLADIQFFDLNSIPRTTSGKKQRLLAARLMQTAADRLLHRSRSAFSSTSA